MEEFLRYVLTSLVATPGDIAIKKTDSPGKVVFHVAVRKADAPRIIGKGGTTIRAIRNLLQASASKRDLTASLELVEL
jgi:uncharacterized protein